LKAVITSLVSGKQPETDAEQQIAQVLQDAGVNMGESSPESPDSSSDSESPDSESGEDEPAEAAKSKAETDEKDERKKKATAALTEKLREMDDPAEAKKLVSEFIIDEE